MKDTMILYSSYLEKFKKLSDEQFGQLIRAGLFYIATEEVPEIEDALVELSFDVLKVEIDQNNKKYDAICEKKREAGRKGGLAKAKNAKEDIASLADASDAKQDVANVADAKSAKQDLAEASSANQNVAELSKPSFNDNDNENDNDVCILNTNNREREKRERGQKSNDFVPPTRDEVFEFCLSKKIHIDTDAFYDHYQSQNWHKTNGMPVTDWHSCVRSWAKKENNFPRGERSVVEKAIDYEIRHPEFVGT